MNELYPDQTPFLRRYISDQFDFEEIIKMYEERDKDEPFYIFNITMQNHSSYDYDSYEGEIEVTSHGKVLIPRPISIFP